MTTKPTPKSILKACAAIKIKGLYQVAELASIFMNLAWLQDCVEWEAAYEEDGSQLPAQLAVIMHSMADALLAMTAEEVAEVLADLSPQDGGEVAKALCTASAKPIVKAIVAAHLKSGRKLSADSITTLQEACKAIKGGHDMISGMLDDGSADTADTEEKSAAADRVKAAEIARQKRLRDVEVLRLSAV